MEALSSLKLTSTPPLPLTHLQSSTKFHPFNRPRKPSTIFHIPRFSIPPIHTKSSPHHPSKPLSNQQNPSQVSEITTSHGGITNQLSKLAVKLVVGSVFVVGFLGVRPAIALPPQNNAVVEEEREPLKGEDEEMLDKLLEQEPENIDVLKVVVNGKMRKGKMKEALECVERLIDLQPEEVEWRLLKALCYEIMGQLSKAEKLFKGILKDRPLLVRALHGLAMVMHKKGEDGALFEMLHKALQLATREKRVTEERNIMILIAQMHVVMGHFDDALKRFQELIDDNPRDFRPYLCQGIIYSLQEKKQEAEEQFEIYRSLVPEEFPQRGFLDDVVLAAKKETGAQLRKEMNSEFSYKK